MHSFIEKLSRLFAVLGGIVLSVLILLVCLSVLGRAVNSVLNGDFLQSTLPGVASALLATGVGPINGDFELVEAGMAFAIFAFLPLCHINGAHASVDIFTAKLPRRANQMLRAIIEVVFAGVLVIIAYQLFLGMLSKQSSGQTTFLLQFPIWWAYALSVLGAIVAALVSVYVAAARVTEVLTRTVILPDEMGADH
ncbi:TRAP transporter small permease [uncultured Sulfitobacter sp.]|uniref:TRAP transporter small permease n=1 Tax=uncultured Sulfitobacter sp. TaxID=191468 RepID=UPI002611BBEE|nr:TRAP transporter small permease [uncultured Sulfitobacter sp.]